jgi:hypothetical protein
MEASRSGQLAAFFRCESWVENVRVGALVPSITGI